MVHDVGHEKWFIGFACAGLFVRFLFTQNRRTFSFLLQQSNPSEREAASLSYRRLKSLLLIRFE